MAKTRKKFNPSNKKESVADVNDGSKSAPKQTKSAINLKKDLARADNVSVGVMVKNALKALNKGEGVPLVGIRNYIRLNYNNKKKLGKERQRLIKEFITKEFEDGNILMTNCDDELDFTMRFNMATSD